MSAGKQDLNRPFQGARRGSTLHPVRALAGSLLVLLAAGSAGCQGTPVSQPTNKVEHPNITLEGFRLIETDKGQVTWEFQADKALIYEKKNKAFSEKVRIISYENGSQVSVLTADKGMVNTDTNNAEVEGHVVLVGRKKTRLETTRLSWLPKARRLFSQEFVKITYGDGNVLTGTGFRADANLENVKILSPKAKVQNVRSLEGKR